MYKIITSLIVTITILASDNSRCEVPSQNTITKKNIIFFGDSITAGYGLDKDEAYPKLFQDKLNHKNLSYNVINAGLSGETSAGGLRRVDWILKNKVDFFILELGANDALRGLDLDHTYKNLVGIIKKARGKYPMAKIYLCEMKAPPNLGLEYTNKFENIFRKVANDTNIKTIPFILEKVAGNSDLNLQDGIHPTSEGHKVIAENIWRTLAPDLDK